jgi:hypothetical protein
MDAEVLCKWKRHFASVVKPMPQRKGLLLLNEHSSYTLSLAALKFLASWGYHAVAGFPQHSSNAASRCHAFQNIEHILGISDRNEAGRLLAEHTASLVGTAFQRVVTSETAMNGSRNSGICLRMMILLLPWSPIGLGTIKLEKPSADRIGNFSLSCAHAATPGTPKETQSYNGYVSVEKFDPLLSNTDERKRPKSGKKLAASGIVLTWTSHKESLNRPNIDFSGAKLKR